MDCYISAGMASFILLPTGKVFVTNFENLKNKIVIILCAFRSLFCQYQLYEKQVIVFITFYTFINLYSNSFDGLSFHSNK